MISGLSLPPLLTDRMYSVLDSPVIVTVKLFPRTTLSLLAERASGFVRTSKVTGLESKSLPKKSVLRAHFATAV